MAEHLTNYRSVDFPVYVRVGKPVADFLVAALLLLATAPIFALLVPLLWVTNGGRVFFVQPRPGQHGKLFTVFKFRTMRDQCAPDGRLLTDAQRITRVGAWLRCSSLDELPQLFNVLRGQMSLVGPRPLLPDYLPLYSPAQARRHALKPGLTGWAQVNGRTALPWPDRFTLDLYYVNHVSFALDYRILWLTLGKVLRAENVGVEAERFSGNRPSVLSDSVEPS